MWWAIVPQLATRRKYYVYSIRLRCDVDYSGFTRNDVANFFLHSDYTLLAAFF